MENKLNIIVYRYIMVNNGKLKSNGITIILIRCSLNFSWYSPKLITGNVNSNCFVIIKYLLTFPALIYHPKNFFMEYSVLVDYRITKTNIHPFATGNTLRGD